jgi:hypothetical protein
MARRALPGPAEMAAELSLVDATTPAPSGPERWRAYFADVRALRRWYARQIVPLSTLAGLLVLVYALVVDTVAERIIWLLLGIGMGLLCLVQWGRAIQIGVAPFARRPRHLLPWLAFLMLYLGGLAAPYIPGPGWRTGLVCGVAVALTGWVGAALEVFRKVPAFPAEWRRFTGS